MTMTAPPPRRRRCRKRPHAEGAPTLAAAAGRSPILRRARFALRLLLLPPLLLPPSSCLGPSYSAAAAFSSHARPPAPVRRIRGRPSTSTLRMIRNVDLPEALIFYGTSSLLGPGDDDAPSPGVVRILNECADVGTPALLLSEHRSLDEMRGDVASIAGSEGEELGRMVEGGTLALRSSLAGDYPSELSPDHPDYDPDGVSAEDRFHGAGSHAPSPGFLLDAIASVWVRSRGFGGSSGFGVKREGADVRSPLPKHCVVAVSTPDDRPWDDDPDAFADGLSRRTGVVVAGGSPRALGRARCTAARLAGMRVVALEPGGIGTTDCEDLADAVVEGFGEEGDREAVSLEDVATPGSFWLNPPLPRDDDGNAAGSMDAVCRAFRELREEATPWDGRTPGGKKEKRGWVQEPAADEDEIRRILGDMNPT